MTPGTDCLFITQDEYDILSALGFTGGWVSGVGGYYHLIDDSVVDMLNENGISFDWAPYISSTYSAGTG